MRAFRTVRAKALVSLKPPQGAVDAERAAKCCDNLLHYGTGSRHEARRRFACGRSSTGRVCVALEQDPPAGRCIRPGLSEKASGRSRAETKNGRLLQEFP